MNAKKIAVIGDRESIMGFRALGLDVFPATEETAAAVFARLTGTEDAAYAIIYITEELAALLSAQIAVFQDALVPAVIPIPSKNGSLGLGMTALTSAVERAVGTNIL